MTSETVCCCDWASPGLRLAALLVLLVVAGTLAVRGGGWGLTQVRELVESAGPAAPLVFVAVYAVAATLLLPAAPFTIGAGLLFGPLVGTAAALAGAILGASGAFGLGRMLGRSAVQRFGGRRTAALDAHLARHGFVSLLVVRLVPLFPFNLVNLVAGVTGMPLRVYVLATAVGIVPGTVAYAALGGTIDDPTSPAFLAALGLFVLVTVGAGLASRRFAHTATDGRTAG